MLCQTCTDNPHFVRVDNRRIRETKASTQAAQEMLPQTCPDNLQFEFANTLMDAFVVNLKGRLDTKTNALRNPAAAHVPTAVQDAQEQDAPNDDPLFWVPSGASVWE